MACAGKTSERTEVIAGSLKAAEALDESCFLLFLCILIMATQVCRSSPPFEKERVRASLTACPTAMSERSLERSFSSADGSPPNRSDDGSHETRKGVPNFG